MKNILVLIDLNKEPEDISRSALKIAHQLHANLIISCLQHSTSLIEELHDGESFIQDEKHFSNTEELADFLREDPSFDTDFNQLIECIDMVDDEPQAVKKFVVTNNIWMIIQHMPSSIESDNENFESSMMNILKCINCPHLFIPEHMHLPLIDKIAYLTDLRYCDTGVVRFLKTFNAFIFITHLSANGLPDIVDNYAQAILSEEIAVKTRYNKLFLRNIKQHHQADDLEKVIDSNHIQICAIVNKKHQLFEELFSGEYHTMRNPRHIPLLILPFFDWHVC